MCSSLPLRSWRGIQQKGPACGAQSLTSPKLYKHSRNADRPRCPEGVPGAWGRGAKTSNHEATTSAASSTAVLADRAAWPGQPCACWHDPDMAGGPRPSQGWWWPHHLPARTGTPSPSFLDSFLSSFFVCLGSRNCAKGEGGAERLGFRYGVWGLGLAPYGCGAEAGLCAGWWALCNVGKKFRWHFLFQSHGLERASLPLMGLWNDHMKSYHPLYVKFLPTPPFFFSSKPGLS